MGEDEIMAQQSIPEVKVDSKSIGDDNTSIVTDDESARSSDEEIQIFNKTKISCQDSVIILSFKLPLQVQKNQDGAWIVKDSKSILNNTLFNLNFLQPKKDDLQMSPKTTWIGWPGVTPAKEADRNEIKDLLS